MKRGFILTAIAVILFILLLDLAFQYSKTSSSYSKTVSDITVSEKIGYTFDDITDDITNITGLSIVQNGANLIFSDSFPGAGITDKLGHYETFMRNYYLTPDMEVTFLNPAEQQINLEDLTSKITVLPFGMTYEYTDFAKRDLFIEIPYTESNAVQFVWFNITVTNANFTKNVSDIKWAPQPKSCTPGDLGCIKFYMGVNDSGGHEYVAPYNTFDITQKADLNIDFSNETCNLYLWVGHYSSEDYILDLKITDCQVKTEIGFSFNTTNFWLDFPTKMKVRDVNYNTSKEDEINLIMTRVLR